MFFSFRRHGFVFFIGFGFSGILSLLKPPSPRLHHNWFHSGCQTGFQRHISCAETSYLKKVAFSKPEGNDESQLFPLWMSHNLQLSISRQVEAANSPPQMKH